MVDADPGMQVKMNVKCFPEIKELAQGKPIDESGLLELIAFVEKRHDCADFRVLSLLKAYLSYRAFITPETVMKMERCFLDFKYWMDEDGVDGMCYWSENHQLIFHTAEYLAGKLFPDKSFSNSQLTGKEHVEKARPKLLFWLQFRFQYGLIEWHSNTYYEEDIAPLSLLIDYADDPELIQKATLILDLILLDMATHSFEGYFVGASGRCYETQKQDPKSADVNDILKKAFGILNHEYDYSRLSALFLLSTNYQVPEVIRKIAQSQEPFLIQDSMGLDLNEVKKVISPHEIDHLGMIYWQMEAFTNRETIEMTLDIFNRWKLHENTFLKDLKMVNIPILRKLRLLPLVLKILNPATQGVAIERANTYTYRTKDYLLSSVQHYHPRAFGDQQHLWQATLPNALTVFSTHPGSPMFSDEARNFSPSYWVGNGIQPDSYQHKNTLLLYYDLTPRKGFLEKARQEFVHFYFPFSAFDEVQLEEKAVYGRKKDTYIAILSDGQVETGNAELIYRGKKRRFVVVLGEKESAIDFSCFREENQPTKLVAHANGLSFLGKRTLHVDRKQGFFIQGVKEDINFPRLEAPFAHVKRNPDTYLVRYHEHSLLLDFKRQKRVIE